MRGYELLLAGLACKMIAAMRGGPGMEELHPSGMKRYSVALDRGAPAIEISRRLVVLNRLLAISADDSSLQEQLDRGLDAILSTHWLQTQPVNSFE